MSVEEAINLINELLDEKIPELPERAEEFADSVSEKLSSMKTTILRSSRVTEPQATAIRNMEQGISNWLER